MTSGSVAFMISGCLVRIRGNGAKLLILAPQMAIPDGLDTDEYTVIRNGSNIAFFGIRALMPDPAEADQLLSSFRIFPPAGISTL